MVQIAAVKVRKANRSRVPRCCHLRQGVSNTVLTEQFPFKPCICIRLYNVYTGYVYMSLYITLCTRMGFMELHESVVHTVVLLIRVVFLSQPAASNSSGPGLPYRSSLRAPTYPRCQCRKRITPLVAVGLQYELIWKLEFRQMVVEQQSQSQPLQQHHR